jgi:poly[(R)-3-hydroxyalkanoate] polymerase subunit PhaC
VTPRLPAGDVLSGLRREIERTAIRARNGIRYAAGAEWAPISPTPSEVVWEDGKVRLRHYRRDGPPTLGPPVLLFLGLVGRSYVFDLWQGNSIVGLLKERGFDVFVLDWGVPDERDAGNTLETYLQCYFPRAIRALLDESGAADVNVLSYCMGGNLALHALAGQPTLPIRSLVTMATPVDFTHLGPVIDLLREGRIDPDAMLDEDGNVPGALVRQSFKLRKPTGDLVQYANLWQHLWNDEYMEGFQAIGRFLQDHIPIPGAIFRQIVEQWVRGNGFMEDRLRLGGRRVSLGVIGIPVLGVVAERDDIVPEEATVPLVDVLGGTDVELMRLDAGHASLTSGRKAVNVVLPHVFEWIAGHSEEVA